MTFFGKQFWIGLVATVVIGTVFAALIPSLAQAGLPFAGALVVAFLGCRGVAFLTDGDASVPLERPAMSSGEVASEIRGALSDTARQVDEQHRAVAAELAQVQTVLGNAISQLTESFQGLYGITETQRKVTISVTAGNGEDESAAGFEEFVHNTSEVMQKVVDSVVANSKLGMELVDLTDSIAARTRDVQGILSEIGAIAKQTNLLALNAAIEAARAGEAGRGFAVVADEVRDLSGRTTQFSQQINAMMQSMQQSVRQTEEAIQRMASQDMTFALESKSRVAEIIETMEGENRKRADAIARLGESAGQVDTQVARAVTALQFQDLVSQLVGRVRQRVDGIQEVSRELAKLGDRIASAVDGKETSSAIEAMRRELERIGGRMAGLGASKGESTETNSQAPQGDIELF